MSDTPLYLLHTHPDVRLLAGWMARHPARHQRNTADLGDAFHGLLRAAFGAAAPQPFRYVDASQGLLAYTPLDAEALQRQVALAGLGNEAAVKTLGLDATAQHDGYRLRPFPTQWPQGKVLRFEVRVRPTVRTAKGERDAFLHAVEQAQGAPLQREGVYVRWLRDHLSAPEGATPQPWQGAVELLDDVHLAGFQRQQVVRRIQAAEGAARHDRLIDGPDALLKGHLRVRDSTAFAHLLARGVGRHRAFGFGMLLLARPD